MALDAGQAVEFESTQVFSVKSQDNDHPFAFSQYMLQWYASLPDDVKNAVLARKGAV